MWSFRPLKVDLGVLQDSDCPMTSCKALDEQRYFDGSFFFESKILGCMYVCDVIICDLRRWVPCFRCMSFCGASQMQGRWSKMFLFQSITPRPAHAAFVF